MIDDSYILPLLFGVFVLIIILITYALMRQPKSGASKEGYSSCAADDYFGGEFEQREIPHRTLPGEAAEMHAFRREANLAALEDRETAGLGPRHTDDMSEHHMRLQAHASGRVGGKADSMRSRFLTVDSDLQTGDPHRQAEIENRVMADARARVRTTRGAAHTNAAHTAHSGGPTYGALTPGHINVPNTAFVRKNTFEMLYGGEAF